MGSRFIKSSGDLVTSHDATRSGFLAQALQKTEKATPYVVQAHRAKFRHVRYGAIG